MVRPVERILRHGGPGFGGGRRGARAVLRELQILLVEQRDLLSGRHAVAHIDGPFHDLARDAKAKLAFDARRDHTRIGERPFARRGGNDEGFDRAHRLLRNLGLAAGGKRYRKQQNCEKG